MTSLRGKLGMSFALSEHLTVSYDFREKNSELSS